jgi:hypothetical protein
MQQTVEIPTDRRVYFDMPQEVPCGMADFEIIVSPRLKTDPKSDWRELRGIFKSDVHAVDRFLESRREDKRIEDEKDERQRQESKRHKQ